MSKPIYAEAVESAQILNSLVNLREVTAKRKLDMLTQIERALQQAQKQERLLELYKEAYSMMPWSTLDILRFQKAINIKNQIEELENGN